MPADQRPTYPVLGFRDRKQDGRLPVDGPDGQPVAFITTHSSSSFEVVDSDGGQLCTGSARLRGFSQHREALDPTGARLVEYRARWRKETATLADGRSFTITGKWLGGDWQAAGDAGTVALSSTAGPGRGAFHPDDWLVTVHDPTLTMAEVVAVVELHRLAVQSTRAATFTAAGTVAVTG